jgi:hypothetical protein
MNAVQVQTQAPTAVVSVVPQHFDIAQLKHRVSLVRTVMKDLMKENSHYGVIPGCKKPSLWQPGAQLLNMTFRVAPKIQPGSVEDLSTADEARYRVTLEFYHQITGEYLGVGIGECSSLEEKWAWRRAVAKQEWDATDPERRREKWANGKGGSVYSTYQVRTNKQDVANTVLKIAKKRALVNGTNDVCAASEVFTQDMEDMDEAMIGNGEPVKEGQAETGTQQQAEDSDKSPTDEARNAGRMITKKQEERLYSICRTKGVNTADVKAFLRSLEHPIKHFWELSRNKGANETPSNYERLCTKIENDPAFFAGFATKPPTTEAPAGQQPAADPAPTVTAAPSREAFENQIYLMSGELLLTEAQMDQECAAIAPGCTFKTAPEDKFSEIVTHFNGLLSAANPPAA